MDALLLAYPDSEEEKEEEEREKTEKEKKKKKGEVVEFVSPIDRTALKEHYSDPYSSKSPPRKKLKPDSSSLADLLPSPSRSFVRFPPPSPPSLPPSSSPSSSPSSPPPSILPSINPFDSPSFAPIHSHSPLPSHLSSSKHSFLQKKPIFPKPRSHKPSPAMYPLAPSVEDHSPGAYPEVQPILPGQQHAAEQFYGRRESRNMKQQNIKWLDIDQKEIAKNDFPQEFIEDNLMMIKTAPQVAEDDRPTYLQKRRHQITSLAFDAQRKEWELMHQRASAKKTKAETNAKYGW